MLKGLEFRFLRASSVDFLGSEFGVFRVSAKGTLLATPQAPDPETLNP